MGAIVLAIADRRLQKTVAAALAIEGLDCLGGEERILITDADSGPVSPYSHVILLGHAPVDSRPDRVILPLPLRYADLGEAVRQILSREAAPQREEKETHTPLAKEGYLPGIVGDTVIWKDKQVKLTGREMALFRYLYSRPGQIVTREELLLHVWNGGSEKGNVTDVYVSYLREKLTELFGPGVLVSVRKKGYMLRLPADMPLQR